MITFSQLKQGDPIYLLEVIGTFKKSTNYYDGYINAISAPYDEQLPQLQFPIPGLAKRKLVDLTLICSGELLSLTVEEGKSMITDTSNGLTVSTEKKLIFDRLNSQYETYKAKKEAVAKYDEEMAKCLQLLTQLNYKDTIAGDPKVERLESEVLELRDILKQASALVPAEMRLLLPENIQNKLNEVGH